MVHLKNMFTNMKSPTYKITNYCWDSQAFELTDEWTHKSYWVHQDGFGELNVDQCQALVGKEVETKLVPSFMNAINPVIIL